MEMEIVNLVYEPIEILTYWFIPALLGGLSFLGGALGNRKQTQTSGGTSSTSSSNSSEGYNTTDTYGTSRVAYDPTQLAMRDQILGRYSALMQEDPDLKGYEAQGIRDINRTNDLEQEALQGNLAARGVTGPAAAHALAANNSGRFRDVTEFRSGVPLLARNMKSDILGKAGGFFSSLPVGQDTHSYSDTHNLFSSNEKSNTNQTGNVTSPGNVAGSGFGNLASVLAYLYGQR